MKHIIPFILIAIVGIMAVNAQVPSVQYPWGKPATEVSAADTFVVDFSNKRQLLQFKDPNVKRCALAWDCDNDGELSVGEAECITGLWLLYPSRRDMFVIRFYDDLRFFPNLEYLHAGKSWGVEVIDLSHNPRLKEVDLSSCDWKVLKGVSYAEGVTMVQKSSGDPLWRGGNEDHVYVREDLADKPEALPSYQELLEQKKRHESPTQ